MLRDRSEVECADGDEAVAGVLGLVGGLEFEGVGASCEVDSLEENRWRGVGRGGTSEDGGTCWSIVQKDLEGAVCGGGEVFAEEVVVAVGGEVDGGCDGFARGGGLQEEVRTGGGAPELE